MTTVVITVVLLSILIFIHEFGHFIVSRILGVPVEEFSIGFGPKLFSFYKWNTEFKVSLIPFGGYVKIFGEDKDDESSFWRRPLYIKFPILIAGIIFNLMFGVFVFFLLYFAFGINEPAGPYIDSPPENTPAYLVGLKEGDKIVSIDGNNFTTWKEFYAYFQNKEYHVLKILRKRDTVSFKIKAEWIDSLSKFETGIYPLIKPVVGEVLEGFPAQNSGIRKGDTIVQINNRIVNKWEDIQKAIEEGGGDTLVVKVKRGNKILSFKIKPKIIKESTEKGIKESYKLGIRAEIKHVKVGFFDAWKYAVNETVFIITHTFKVFYYLITGKTPIGAIGGPVMIGKIIGEGKERGVGFLIFILAFISIQLAIINILPFPALDGGHILIIFVESIVRKRLSYKTRVVVQAIGFGILIFIAILITIFDIIRVFG